MGTFILWQEEKHEGMGIFQLLLLGLAVKISEWDFCGSKKSLSSAFSPVLLFQITAFYSFFQYVNICHLLFHLLWPCLLHWHLPSAPFPFSYFSSSSPVSSQYSHLFRPFSVSANMLWFLPNLKANLALPISPPAHLLQSNIPLQPFTKSAPITRFINLFPAQGKRRCGLKIQAHTGCTVGLYLPTPSTWSLDILFSLRSCSSWFLLLFILLVLLLPS